MHDWSATTRPLYSNLAHIRRVKQEYSSSNVRGKWFRSGMKCSSILGIEITFSFLSLALKYSRVSPKFYRFFRYYEILKFNPPLELHSIPHIKLGKTPSAVLIIKLGSSIATPANRFHVSEVLGVTNILP